METNPAWSAAFTRAEGWTGADVANSIALGSERTLWVFADTFIGRIEKRRRLTARMINNTFAWQPLANRQDGWRFFWKGTLEEPQAILRPATDDQWYWPGDGALLDGRLYLLAKLVRKKERGAPGFQFDWCGNHLLEIENPQDEPTTWKYQAHALPNGPDEPQLSAACLVDDDFLYFYGLFPAKELQNLHRPLAIARLRLADLPPRKELKLEYLCRRDGSEAWSTSVKNLSSLFSDAAPEMTVNHMAGWPGYVATYTSLGLGGEIIVRFANHPEGPWSDALRIYHCPEADRALLVYGARSHPELATRDGELVITYCVNTGSLKKHMEHADIYVPRALTVQLRAGSSNDKP